MTINRFHGTYAWLSNFWPVPVILDGVTYKSVEHAYQAAKFPVDRRAYFQDPACTAAHAKAMGKAPGKLEGWQDRRDDVMSDLINQKFGQEPYLTQLVETGEQEILEGNVWGDSYWGVALATGKGENRLGRMIMIKRDYERSLLGL